jgi:hypothetical protein
MDYSARQRFLLKNSFEINFFAIPDIGLSISRYLPKAHSICWDKKAGITQNFMSHATN